jgi:multicomponent Na+:H+ antiporter subunit D
MLAYFAGHGLVKGALFMVAGILLATQAGIDEIGLRGMGKPIWPAGVAMGLAGLLLAGLPVGAMRGGSDLIEAAARDAGRPWLIAVLMFGAAGTGAAVLRAAGRIFLGLGPVAGEEESAPTEAERENANRPLWLMLAPTIVLLALVLPFGAASAGFGWQAAERFMHPDGMDVSAVAMPAPAAAWHAWASVAIALGFAAVQLFRHRLPRWLTQGAGAASQPVTAPLAVLHSGLVGDYVAWLVVGLALFTACFALG